MKLFSKNNILIGLLIVFCATAQGQTRRVLFLGNSYTYVNNLPQITKDFAASVSDSMVFDNNTPGGYTLQGHASNSTSIGKISQGNWDVVVLQEQSQRPSFPIAQVEQDVFPYARQLDSLIDRYNTCPETMFYMTWGRKNGDASNCVSWPPVCTYDGMDSLLRLRYMMMADSNNAAVSPVGAVWRYIRQQYPTINLYQADESHPSAAGSYAAACCFYTAIFKKDPTLSSFNYSLSASDAANIRSAAKIVVFDSLLNWNLKDDYLSSSFSFTRVAGYTYQFTNLSQNASGQLWDFGGGLSDTSMNPTHTFPGPGKYLVKLMSFNGCDTAYSEHEINITLTSIYEPKAENTIEIIPNPAGNEIRLVIEKNTTYPISIYSVDGEKVMEIQYNTGTIIDVSSLTSGLYFIHTRTENGFARSKFVKK